MSLEISTSLKLLKLSLLKFKIQIYSNLNFWQSVTADVHPLLLYVLLRVCDVTITQQDIQQGIFMKLALAGQRFVKNCYTEFHENTTNRRT
jgi:hypothetical protein